MNMKLISLEIRDFKGIRNKLFRFDGCNASIYGDNATGKSTIYDALTWLLFDKDTQGQSATKFDIKPLDESGNVRAVGIIPTVIAVLDVDGEQLKLCKEYKEVWTKKRGSVEQELTGHTNDYAIDDIPKKENEYKAAIAALVDEKVFRQQTNVYHFCRDTKWQDRRAKLFEMCQVQSDDAILFGQQHFAPLVSAKKSATVEDFKSALLVRRRNANSTLNDLPVRMDECRRTIVEMEQVDFTELRTMEAHLRAERDSLSTELLKLDNSALLAEKKNAYSQVNADVRQLEMDNREFRTSQQRNTVDERPALLCEINHNENMLRDVQGDKQRLLNEITRLQTQIEQYHEQWDAVDKRVYSNTDVCQSCGQALPADKVLQAHANFATIKQSDLKAIEAQAVISKDALSEKQQHLAEIEQQLCSLSAQLKEAQDKLSKTKPPKEAVISDMPDYQEKLAALQAQIAALDSEIKTITNESESVRSKIKLNLADTDAKLHNLRSELAKEAILQQTENRLLELQEQRAAQGKDLEQIEQLINLCEEFSRYKADCITDTVNSLFQIVHWRLFDTRINGAVEDCCDVLINGVPYNSLNNAAKINAGLDVIAAFGRASNIQVPLFIDNAESVTSLQDPYTQLVRLVVSEQDKELRCEIES